MLSLSFLLQRVSRLRNLLVLSEGQLLILRAIRCLESPSPFLPPAMMGTKSFVTTETGSFRFPSLPPGTYKVVAELKGFKTVERTDIIVRVGMTVTVDINMEVAAVEEEITVVAASPVVDVQSSKLAVTVDSNMLKNIPLRRDLYDIMTAAPGVVSEGVTYRRTFSAHGATVRSNTTAFDGVNMNDPVVMYTLTNINLMLWMR